jgi:3-hydroxyacyl-CoA dehydrogenase
MPVTLEYKENHEMDDKITYTRYDDIAVLRVQNPPVNALSHAVRAGLMAGIERAEADEGVLAMLLIGDDRTFIAGADVNEFGKPPLKPSLADVCNRIEASALLVVASMHGVSLGGGLEIALSAHYRVAQPTAKVGLPEVHLGLIPGAGGTQRLPRLTGVIKALDMITSGRHVAAPEAYEMGVVDRMTEGDPQEVGMVYTRELLDGGAKRRPVSEMNAPAPIDWDAAYKTTLATGRGQVSPAEAVRAVQASVEQPFPVGLEIERRIFKELMETNQRQGMIHAFFSERAVSKLPELKDVEPRTLQSIGIIGGGTMGAGIATAALLSGFEVVLIEMKDEAVQAARDRIDGNLRGALKRNKITQDKFNALMSTALTLSTNYESLASADLVIEAVYENMDVKKDVFGKLDAVCKKGAILATNTSYLDVNKIAESTSRPEDVLGLHFFSPAYVMKLLEIVVADQTAPEVTATGFALGKALGKISVRAGVCDGFIGNRILATCRTAADHIVLDGASPYQIDKALLDFGFAMGPFAVADLAGLDIGWATRKRKAAERYPDEHVPTYIDRLCEQGHFGQKTGKGFYIYESAKCGGVPNPEISRLIEEEQKALGITPCKFTDEEIVRHYMAAMVNEAAKVVGEDIARRPLDVDMALLFGYGFPRYWGGPLKWADLQGLPALLSYIEGYSKDYPWFWQPSPLLMQLVAEGRNFDDLNKQAAKA